VIFCLNLCGDDLGVSSQGGGWQKWCALFIASLLLVGFGPWMGDKNLTEVFINGACDLLGLLPLLLGLREVLLLHGTRVMMTGILFSFG